MNINSYLLLGFSFALFFIGYLILKLRRVRQQISFIQETLEDFKRGNFNRRVLTYEKDMTRQICYDINEIAMSSQSRLIQQRKAEQSYKRLMTSLSHDVKTPLTSLVGYLEAIENGLVMDEEKDEYVHVAFNKANRLKAFVEALFEWVKLDAGEQIFHFEPFDINELTRNIMAEWITVLERAGLNYDIEIPEMECTVCVDKNAYSRILNNLLQNIIDHSHSDQVILSIEEDTQEVKIKVADKGKGISKDDLPHIFERMYQCDCSRSLKGSGLGLSIIKELVSVHKGKIEVESIVGSGTTFTIILPKAL